MVSAGSAKTAVPCDYASIDGCLTHTRMEQFLEWRNGERERGLTCALFLGERAEARECNPGTARHQVNGNG